MCGIAGLVDLSGVAAIPHGCLQRMAAALVHRGPDDQGFFEGQGVGLAVRRLAVVGLDDGHQPVTNEDGRVVAIFNGECFDYLEVRRALERRGHRLTTRCDSEVLPHLWEEHREGMFEKLRGQFAAAVYDDRRRTLTLARDRFGICPLYWTRQQRGGADWLLFASEIKALLASGLVSAAPDLRGIDQVFHFFATPGPATCFKDIQLLQPGHWLSIELGAFGSASRLRDHRYWSLDFPRHGEEDDGDAGELADRLELLMLAAVERRLRADVPVVSYVSGGLDSSTVAAMAARIRGTATPAFSVRVDAPGLDESAAAAVVARHLGAASTSIRVGPAEVAEGYPEVVCAAEAPVIDTAAAATLRLAEEVHHRGFKVALTGEGADEWLGGYPWDKIHRWLTLVDRRGGPRPSRHLRRAALQLIGVPPRSRLRMLDVERALGHRTAFQEIYGLMTAARFLFFSEDTLATLAGHNPYLELAPDLDRVNTWHPLNRNAYWASRIHLAGHLLSLKGDRMAMRSSVETRYPFLDEDVVDFLARVPPRLKQPGMVHRDKYLLRLVAARYLPKEIAWRRKVMFRAPLDSFFGPSTPQYVDELLSEASLQRTGLFQVKQVQRCRERLRAGNVSARQRLMVELGMVGVVTTQLWYHTFIDASLADLSAWTAPHRVDELPVGVNREKRRAALATSRP